MMAFLSLLVLVAAQPNETVWRSGFEAGDPAWSLPEGSMGEVTDARAASGERALRIVDTDDDRGGSNVTSPRFAVEPGRAFTLRMRVLTVSGSGLGIYPRIYDGAGEMMLPGDYFHRGAPSQPTGEWLTMETTFFAPKGAVEADIWIHSYSHATVEAYIDDVEVIEMGSANIERPWPPQYKLDPEEQDRLTPADVVGPDGIVYPDWRYAGVPGGVPHVETVVRLRDFGGLPDGADISVPLELAVAEAARLGGGAIELEPGQYNLARPVFIYNDGIVIRGAGQDETQILFTYRVPPRTVQFFTPTDGLLTPSTPVEIHANPEGLQAMEIRLEGEVLRSWEPSTHSGNTFQLYLWGSEVLDAEGEGDVTLTAYARWDDGSEDLDTLTVEARRPRPDEPDPHLRMRRQRYRAIAALTFAGAPNLGPRLLLAADGDRGDLWISLQETDGLSVGDAIHLEAPATDRWKSLTMNQCPWGTYRRYEFRVEEIEGNRVRLNQPLRIDYPVIDDAYVQRREPIRRCGVESLTIEQTENLWISAVMFSAAWECWAGEVTVRMCGRWPVYALEGKWCEIWDCVFDDAWFKGGGGTAYAGWERSYDCLMENVVTRSFRHAPLVQWSSAGNVIRRSLFEQSDGQWHSGWTNENLFENCVIESVADHGAYGYGLWASPPEDQAHGPNGPRNVVWGCDISSPRAGLWMGGMNEGWLIAYNRFVVEQGPGVFAKTFSFDHTIRGNHFEIRDGASPMVLLQTPDCLGVEVIDNRLYATGDQAILLGPTEATLAGNEIIAGGPAPLPERPVDSIFDWQRGL